MRRAWPVTLLAVGLAGVLVLSSRFPVAASGLWAVDAALTQVIVLWPVVAGLTAADAVRLRRSGAVDLLHGAPTTARARLLLGRSVCVAAWAGLGVLIGVLGAAALAGSRGSPPPWSAWPDVVLAVTGVVTAALTGTALGVLAGAAGQWVVPPVVVAAGYGALALDLGGASRLVAFTGATDASVTAIDLRTSVLVGQLVVFACIGAAAAAAVVAASGGGWPATTAAAVLLLLVVPAGASWRAHVDAGVHTWADPSRWPCTPVGSQSRACLPPDQEHDLLDLAAQLEPIDLRLRELDPTTAALRYQPGDPGAPRPGIVVVRPPIDPSGRAGQVTWDVVLGASRCADAGESAWTSDELDLRTAAEVAVARWLSPTLDVSDLLATWQLDGGREPLATAPTLEQASEALDVLRSCRGAW